MHASKAKYYLVTLWAIQTQLLSQIIANRVSLIMVSKRKAKWLKICLVCGIGCVNIAVYVIWTSAYLPDATPAQKHLNDIFEKAEKSFFLVVDLGLNLCFLYLVRFRLISGGLNKYWPLFNLNAALVCVATAMDAALLGMLSLPNPYLLVFFRYFPHFQFYSISPGLTCQCEKIRSVCPRGLHRQALYRADNGCIYCKDCPQWHK